MEYKAYSFEFQAKFLETDFQAAYICEEQNCLFCCSNLTIQTNGVMSLLRFLIYLFFFCLNFQLSSLLFAQNKQSSASDTTSPKVESVKARDVLTGNTPQEKIYTVRKKEFIDNATEDFTDTSFSDLTFTFNSDKHLPLYLDKEGLKGLAPFKDSVQDQIQRDTGIPQTVSLTDAIQSLVQSYQKKQSQEVKDLTVPTDTEIDVLKILWVEESATASEIYAKLDSSASSIHSEELQDVLNQMVTKGFLDREKISPSHEFNLFGFAQIELSSKNRKNKVYLYWPIVTKEKLFTYLDAQRYMALVQSQSKNDIDLKNKKYESNYQIYLEKKLYRLFE